MYSSAVEQAELFISLPSRGKKIAHAGRYEGAE